MSEHVVGVWLCPQCGIGCKSGELCRDCKNVSLEAENKELKGRIAELEQHNNNFHESLKEAMKPENWQQ